MLAIAGIFYSIKKNNNDFGLGEKFMWKNIRVACLLLVLLIVAINAYRMFFHMNFSPNPKSLLFFFML